MNKTILLIIFLAYELNGYSQITSPKVRGRTGDYIREKGPVETYRIEKDGPRLFVYSREYTYSDTSGFHTGHDYFFRKGTTGDMQEMNFKNLQEAMADNAASMRQLQASRSTLTIGGIIGGAGLLLTVIGGVQLLGQNHRTSTLSTPPTLRDLQFGRLPTQPAPPPKKTGSPLLIAGPVIMVGAMFTLFTASGHIEKAIRIYNQ